MIWAPNPFLGVSLRPYTIAGTAVLAFMAAVSFGLIAWRREARIGGLRPTRNSAGTLAGLTVMCPACSAAPSAAFLIGLLGPAAGTAGGAVDYGRLVALSLALMILSVSIMWIGITRMSRLDWPRAPAVSETPEADGHPGTRAVWFLRIAWGLALLALVLDLSAAPAGGGGVDTHLAPVAHPPAALFAAGAGVVAASVGVALHPFAFASGRRLVALKVGLIALYADGVIHWLAVLEHIGSGSQMAFFLVSGAAQIGAVWPWGRFPPLVWIVGVPFTIALIGLYFVTRVVPAPFEVHAEPFEALGAISKAVEMVMLASLGAALDHRRIVERLKASVAAFGTRALSRLA